MGNEAAKTYGYRWVVLLVFSLITAAIQMQWLTFAPIAREARLVYEASALQIDLLSMIFMGVFLIVCLPASYIIDTYGIRIGVSIGAVLTGIFSLLKGLFATDYSIVLISQIGLAVAQPFILNAVTKVAILWFPINERATAVGIGTLAQFLGVIFVMVATPLLVTQNADGVYQLSGMLMIYGMIAVAASIILLVFLKERPETPSGHESQDDRFTVFQGMKHVFKQKDMRLIMVLFFIGLGMFNAISTCIDQICQLKGLSTEQTGLIGGMMLIAGIIGGIVLPMLSDRLRKRKAFLILGMIGMTPGLIGLTFASHYVTLLVSSFVFGFFLLGAGAPVGFQYSAEISYPVPESTTQGLILLVGQASGILFILGMNTLGMIPFMVTFIGLAVVNIILCFVLKESTMILT